MKNSVKKILNVSDKTYYNWKKGIRPIIKLLEQYFSKEDLEEFLQTGKIAKQDRLKELEKIEKKYNDMISYIEAKKAE